MTDRELDHMLAGEPEIEPSKAFVENVMKAVHREAQTPPALGFPWLLAIPGVFACGLTLICLLAAFFLDPRASGAATRGVWFDFSILKSALQSAVSFLGRTEVLWIGVALVVTLVCVAFPLRLLRGRS